MVVAMLGSSVVSSVWLTSNASHDSPSCSQSGGVVGVFGSDPRGEETSYYHSHHPAWGGIDEKGGNGASVECGWENVVFEPSRDLGEVREVEFLCIFERVHVGRVRLIPARWWFLSKDVASC